jgi:hypothetical protein
MALDLGSFYLAGFPGLTQTDLKFVYLARVYHEFMWS